MSVVLYRVDERLIHGQVVVGWGSVLNPDRIVVVDDALAASDWEQELYAVGVPPEIETAFVSTEDARAQLPAWQDADERMILLTRDIAAMAALATEGALDGADVNIGGVHHAPGRTQVLRYVFLDDTDRSALRTLVEAGADVSARDVPGARRVGSGELLAS